MRHVTVIDGKTVFVDGNDEYNDPVGLAKIDTPAEIEEQRLLNLREGSWCDPENHSAREVIGINNWEQGNDY